MQQGIISKEFFIGRYIYLTDTLRKLPLVTYNRNGSYPVISIRQKDPITGKITRRRISQSNPEWEIYKPVADKRALLEKQLKHLLSAWKAEYTGSLEDLSSQYFINPNTDNVFDSMLWESLKSNENTYPMYSPVKHNGILMRSLFEVDVADILENMGIEYKYEAGLRLGPDVVVFPDFALNYSEYNRCGFMEALGGMNNFKYSKKNAWKLNHYFNAGIYPNRDLALIPGDEVYRPDHDTMRRVIGVMCDAMARQYVVRRSDTDSGCDPRAPRVII